MLQLRLWLKKPSGCIEPTSSLVRKCINDANPRVVESSEAIDRQNQQLSKVSISPSVLYGIFCSRYTFKKLRVGYTLQLRTGTKLTA